MSIMDITKSQHSVLTHSLGISGGEKECRNYYVADPDSFDCNSLVNKGMMRLGELTGGGLCCFHVTSFGRQVANSQFTRENK